jgi:monoamine oxidase
MRKKIIVIGAGIAGLAPANRLIEFEYDVLILEARNRCGGRIWPDHSLGVTFGRCHVASWIRNQSFGRKS